MDSAIDTPAPATGRNRVPSLKVLAWTVLVPLALIALGWWQAGRGAADVATYTQVQADLPRTLAEIRAIAAQNPMAPLRFEGAKTSLSAALAVKRVEEALASAETSVLVARVRGGLAWVTLGGAALALLAGLAVLGLANVAGLAARRSRERLVRAFALVRSLLPFLLGTQVAGLAVSALAATIFEAAGLWFSERVSGGGMKLAGAGLVLAGLAVVAAFLAIRGLRQVFALSTPEPLEVSGRVVDEAAAPGLWRFVRELARRQEAVAPDAIVVGLTQGFFVTEAAVRVAPEERTLEGRTLYVPAGYLGLLSGREVAAILGHELAHFSGADTAYSTRFAPIYTGLWRALGALHAVRQGSPLLVPAVQLGFHTLHTFDVAVARWSQAREFEADRRGAQISGADAAASALVRTSVVAPLIEATLERAYEAPDDGEDDLVAGVGARAAASGLADPAGHLEDRQPHPTDSHPPDRRRIEALGIAVDAGLLAQATRAAGPDEAGLAPAFFADWPGLCRTLSADFRVMARGHRSALRDHLETVVAAIPEDEVALYENGRPVVWTMGIVAALCAGTTVGTLVFGRELGVWQGAGFFAAILYGCLALIAVGAGTYALMLHRRGQAPHLVLSPEGLRSPLLGEPIAWRDVADFSVTADRQLSLQLLLTPEAPLPTAQASRLRVQVRRRKRDVTLTAYGIRRMTPQAFADLVSSYLNGAAARARLATL